MYIIGMDEAGKGALIGSMIISLVMIKSDLYNPISMLKDGIKDSKLLSQKKRKEIISKYEKKVSSKSLEVQAILIDEYTYQNKLNLLIFNSYLKLLSTVMKPGIKTIVYIDAFYNKEKLKNQLLFNFPGFEFIVEHKADQKYKIVSLASIFAKERRQELIRNTGLVGDFGSGYPSDPKTKEYIRNNINKYNKKQLNNIRYSWKINL